MTTVTNVFAHFPQQGGPPGDARVAGAPGHPGEAAATLSAASQAGHEQVVFCQDVQSGLRAIIAIYSTALGPSLGGTRFYPYPTEDAALADVLNLSRAMAYKNAMAGLDLGGGKAVIIGDPQRDKSEALLRAYGRFVQSLGGRYVTGRTVPNGGAGDSSILTAMGVFQGMRAAAEHAWGDPSLAGRLVGVEGVGKVGRRLVEHLLEADARVVICDVNAEVAARVSGQHRGVEVAAGRQDLLARPLDVLAPCA